MVTNFEMGLSSFRIGRRNEQWTAELAWRNRDLSMRLSTPVMNGDHVYGLRDRNSGQLVCFDARTGEVAWVSTGREGPMAGILRSGEHLLYLKGEGELVIARAIPKSFEPVVKYQLSEAVTWSMPAMSDQLLLVRHGSDISAWSLLSPAAK